MSLAEKMADATATAEESERARVMCEHLWHQNVAAWTIFPHASQGANQIRAMTGDTLRQRLGKAEREKTRAHECPEQAGLYRCVFGNPFRPVAFDAAWRTSTAVALARGMYESRDFGAMPILADAVQDAGCDSDAVLSHCRDTTALHVRGCWVIDSILGKQ